MSFYKSQKEKYILNLQMEVLIKIYHSWLVKKNNNLKIKFKNVSVIKNDFTVTEVSFQKWMETVGLRTTIYFLAFQFLEFIIV